jgi:hypothetical protein
MEHQVESQIRELARTGKLPSLETVLAVVAEIRRKYVPLIEAARKENRDKE